MKVLAPATAVLALSLAACQQAEVPAEPEAEATEEASSQAATAEEDIRHFLLQEYPDAPTINYALAWSDLDGDGADEAIVHVAGPYFCGSGGCNTLVLTAAGPMWRKVADMTVSRTPVTVMDGATNGWKDITVAVAGGGGPSGTALLRFDGEAYPGNPTVPPAEMVEAGGTVLLAEDVEFTTLEPEMEGAPEQ